MTAAMQSFCTKDKAGEDFGAQITAVRERSRDSNIHLCTELACDRDCQLEGRN
jgi:hypothetical protein